MTASRGWGIQAAAGAPAPAPSRELLQGAARLCRAGSAHQQWLTQRGTAGSRPAPKWRRARAPGSAAPAPAARTRAAAAAWRPAAARRGRGAASTWHSSRTTDSTGQPDPSLTWRPRQPRGGGRTAIRTQRWCQPHHPPAKQSRLLARRRCRGLPLPPLLPMRHWPPRAASLAAALAAAAGTGWVARRAGLAARHAVHLGRPDERCSREGGRERARSERRQLRAGGPTQRHSAPAEAGLRPCARWRTLQGPQRYPQAQALHVFRCCRLEHRFAIKLW